MNNSKQKVIKIVTVSAILLIFLLVISLIINLVKLSNSKAREARLQKEIAELDQKIAQNDNTIDELKSFDWVDKYAREHLDMKGRDEQAFTPKDED